jgi:ATP-dependent helicase/nuclease subunit B
VPPHVYAISADRPFLATLADGLLAMAGDEPLRLCRSTVLLPTRRAVRALREAFLRVSHGGIEPGRPLLLPRMRAVGDLDADEIDLASGGDGDSLTIPPALPELRRRLLLTRLVMFWGERRGHGALAPGQAAALAAALARLIDTVATEGASFDRLPDLAPEELAEHWQTVLGFLEILPRAWPDMLAAEGAIDAADRRNRVLRRQAELWRRAPPREPVVAAGLSGGIPAIEELLTVVAGLDRGAVILAGLDRGCDRKTWRAIEQDEAHPQHLLAALLKSLELSPDEVPDWPQGSAPGTRSRRLRLVAQALQPAGLTDGWRDLTPEPAEVLDGLSRYDCANPQDEAVTIALLLRRKLETPGATAALVTPDRELARRVAAELGRWGIEIDDSAGLPLSRTPPGTFLRLVLDLADSELAPVPLLAALKHPLAAGGLAPETFRDLARRLERRIRGPRPAPGFAGLNAALAGTEPAVRGFAARLQTCLGALPELLQEPEVRLSDVAAAHVGAAERLAAGAGETGVARLWREAAGEAAARFCHELIEAAQDFPLLPGRHYPALFDALAAGFVVRPAFGRHPRLMIWGLLEARLQQADLLVLGGLNEGTWPGAPAADPWMSRQMRREFEIALPERAIGLAAHDFAQALGAPEVALTRAARREGVPTVPSRWLLRLDTVLRAVGLDSALVPEREVDGAATLLDEPPQFCPMPPAMPRPPLAARPRSLPVTQIETWLRDPYAIYARYVLALKALDELDEDPGRAELGTCVHAALDEFVRKFPQALPDDAGAELLRIGREAFGPILSRPGVWAFWWPRFQRIAQWFVAEERERRAELIDSLSEQKGELAIRAPGGPFIVSAVADRIDRLAAGGLVLVDYKTGALPSAKEIEAAVAVQLPLEGAILRDGAFGALSGTPIALEYWRLTGGDPPGRRHPIGGADPSVLIDRALRRVRALIERFDNPATAYLPTPAPESAPRFSDYRHLERLGEIESEE